MVAPKKIPAEKGTVDAGTADEMRERAAKYRGQAEGVDAAAEDVLGEPEDFEDLDADPVPEKA